MRSWQILSHSPNNFHWQVTQDVAHSSPIPLPSPISLPTMADLLHGSPALLTSHDAIARGDEGAMGDTFSFSNSLFTTGSGKKVTISSSGLVRAKTLLDTIDSNIQSTSKLHAFGEKIGKREEEEEEEEEESPQLKLHRVISNPSVGDLHALKNVFEERNLVSQAPIKFHSAGGRSISISSDALQRARSLLGDPDVGDLFEGGDGDNSVFSFPFKRQTDTAASSDCSTSLVCRVTSGSNFKTKSFTFPLQSSRHRELSTKFPSEGDGINLIKKFDTVGEESGCGWKSTNACGQKPLNGKVVYDSSLNAFSSTRGMAVRRALVDVSNTINMDETNNRQASSGKRRLGLCRFLNLSRQVTSVNAEKYVFHEGSGDNDVGAEAFVHLLSHYGASMHFATKE
ncbi:unnamed protein product [Sphenostylis stenocarpa]|uniref:Uncharacterized protein n=1 Tax=Sphenostylis stenocarpa TaxID=92480 RepID=A0AA86RS27_9FABA|nr:unnamed protein product [Sphenostylis stenocarpa]